MLTLSNICVFCNDEETCSIKFVSWELTSWLLNMRAKSQWACCIGGFYPVIKMAIFELLVVYQYSLK
jgi:hypothetical protein